MKPRSAEGRDGAGGRRWRRCVLAVTAMIGGSLTGVVVSAPGAHAHGTVDQENLLSVANASVCPAYGYGQSFLPTKTNITGFDLMFWNSGTYHYRLIDMSAGGQVLTTGSGTASSGVWTHFDLAAAIPLTLGHRYAIEESAAGFPTTSLQYVCEDGFDPGDYAGGTGTAFGTFTFDFMDMLFRTYYDPTIPPPAGCGSSGDASVPQACTYSSIGLEDTFTVPAGVETIHVVAVGGKGGNASFGQSTGGFGAQVTADIAVVPGTRLYVAVAGNAGSQAEAGIPGTGGFNGGGAGTYNPPGNTGSAGGGGASDVRSTPRDTAGSLDTRLVVAGGGGGAGGHDIFQDPAGGNGGAAGTDGVNSNDAAGGSAGTLTGGGLGGAGGGNPGNDGTEGQGGSGGFPAFFGGPGGGGGGGHFGGGGGGGAGAGPGAGGGGGSSFPATATIEADTSGIPRIVIAWTDPDPDRDDDGIHNSVDLDPDHASVAWSDGTTSGTIASKGGASAVLIEDLAGPLGVKVTTVGSSNQKARLTYRGGNIFVSVPGTAIITDPALDTTIEVLDGTVEFEVTGATSPPITIVAGASATVTWDPDTDELQVEQLTGEPGDVTVNGIAVDPDDPFATVLGTLSARLAVTRGTFLLSGTLRSGAGGDGTADPLTEEVVVRLGSYLFVVPGGSFAPATDGAYSFSGPFDGVKLAITLKPAKGGGWSVKATGKTVTGVTNPVAIGLGIGDDSGYTSINATLR